jgi:hypothetical protein
MKLPLVGNETVQQVAATVAATSGIGALLASATEVVMGIFGVPLPVLLAATAAAFGALSFVSGMTYRGTLGIGVVWTVVGTYGSHLGMAIIGWAIGVALPAGAHAGAALLVAGAGPLLVTKTNVEKARAALGRWLDNIGAPKP